VKTEKPHSELFYSIMQYHYFQNYSTITCYTYNGIKIEGKEMYPIFVFTKFCWSVHS